ncbi:hypothetical protein GWI33_002832 [Rhynchophorus ferrugineus]|uniref:Transmembrane protein 199 n=1 Tax=Rhynchophorus ferrugineus TaxID=354439 RepID=A0A834MKY7_RHYFE|nr:hypothetical protein GWI33_002832 [Rhynchophorus ferrugineus]
MGIKNIVFKNKTSEESTAKTLKLDYLVTEQDKRFINSLVNNKDYNLDINIEECKIKKNTTEGPKLSVHDLYWLYKYIEGENKNNNHKVYLHELIEESEIVLPKNEEIPRNEELEKRCKKLKEQQQNKEYRDMTKNVDNVRKQHPEDTISYQMKKMNQHLIAIIQFIITLAAAFAFGFIGIELLVGTLDFGFRLLLGIICALIVGIAELYFLAKTLNEDLEFDYSSRPEKEMN